MKLSTKGRYGTRALVDLALHPGDEPAQLKQIAQRQDIPLQYLEHLITPLKAGGLVRSIRGPKGGVSLSRPPHEIKLSEIIQLLEGSLAPTECVDEPAMCSRSNSCATREIWCDLKTAMDGILGSRTLQDLVERQRDKEEAEATMYYV